MLRGVSLQLAAGESVALTGESGSGKSTLLHLAGGLDRPDGGRDPVRGAGHRGARRERPRGASGGESVGLVFQQFNLIPSLDVAANLAFQARLAGVHDADWCRALAERLGLAKLLDRYPEQLSGGQQQRVAIGRALAGTAAADPRRRADGQSRRGDGRCGAGPHAGASGGNGCGPADGHPFAAACRTAGAAAEPRGRKARLMLWQAFTALLSHWRRRPLQLAMLLLGLALATALWSAVQAINGEARASYARAAAVIGQDRFSRPGARRRRALQRAGLSRPAARGLAGLPRARGREALRRRAAAHARHRPAEPAAGCLAGGHRGRGDRASALHHAARRAGRLARDGAAPCRAGDAAAQDRRRASARHGARRHRHRAAAAGRGGADLAPDPVAGATALRAEPCARWRRTSCRSRPRWRAISRG